MEKESTIGCCSLFAILLTILFIGLKLASVIDWEWIWVLSPLWIYALCCVALLIIVIILGIFLS